MSAAEREIVLQSSRSLFAEVSLRTKVGVPDRYRVASQVNTKILERFLHSGVAFTRGRFRTPTLPARLAPPSDFQVSDSSAPLMRLKNKNIDDTRARIEQ